MKNRRSLAAFAATALLMLAAPLASAATPPPDTESHVNICGAYTADMWLDFGNSGSTATVVAKASVRQGFSPPAPNPAWYIVTAQVSGRSHDGVPVTTDSQSLDGTYSFPGTPARKGLSVFRSSTCELTGKAIVEVACPNGGSDIKTLTVSWPRCGT